MFGSKGVGLGWLLAVANAHFYLGIAPGRLWVILCGICRAEGPVMELAFPLVLFSSEPMWRIRDS